MSETDDQLARGLLRKVLNGEEPWTPDMRLRIATVAQAYASLAIVTELRRSNEDRSLFYGEMLSFFERLTEEPQPGPEGSRHPEASKGFGYYAEDPSEMCTARSHSDRRAWHRCLRLAGHEGLHEDGMGNAFSKDYPKSDGSLRSGQPAAAPGCRVCGNVDIDDGGECLFGDLTRVEWQTHRQHFFETALSFRTEYGAGLYADQRMMLDFGPCPEES